MARLIIRPQGERMNENKPEYVSHIFSIFVDETKTVEQLMKEGGIVLEDDKIIPTFSSQQKTVVG